MSAAARVAVAVLVWGALTLGLAAGGLAVYVVVGVLAAPWLLLTISLVVHGLETIDETGTE